MRAKITPESRMISLPVSVPKNGFFPNAVKLKRELSKKYPIQSIQLRAKNPLDTDGSIRLFVVVYLLKEVFGPTLRQMVKDVYAHTKKQMAKKTTKKL